MRHKPNTWKFPANPCLFQVPFRRHPQDNEGLSDRPEANGSLAQHDTTN
jgi:hypothetical protein